MTIGIVHMEIPLPPKSVLRSFGREALFLDMDPECIYICDIKNDSAPVKCRAAQLQVDEREFAIRNAQGSETRIRTAIDHLQAEDTLIEPNRVFHAPDHQGDR